MTATKRRPRTVAERYMLDVHEGRVKASRLVRQQIERHMRDLKEGASRGLVFDRKAAQHVIDFFPLFCCGTDGDFFGVPIVLDPAWQALLWILYGWKRKTEEGKKIRRFNVAYSEMGAGNLKSLILSCLCLYELFAFGEKGAEVYAAATDRKTARRVFDTASTMATQSDLLRERLVIGKENIFDPETNSKFEPCASEDQNLQGLRPSFVCIDELHAHRNAGVWDAFYSRLGKRKQPLMFAITNSGFDRNSVCYAQREYSEKVLNGTVPDDTWFTWICGLDPEELENPDGWEDESNWEKANPCWGTAVKLEELRKQAVKAKGDPSSLNTFLRFRLCVWTTSFSLWMPMDKWDLCSARVEIEKLKRRRCWGGLDLSTTTDIAVFALVFEPTAEDPRYHVLLWFFLPKDNVQWRSKRDRVPYDVWAREGLFELTEGSVIDYKAIRARINQASKDFWIQSIAFDRWNSSDLVTNLTEDGFEMVKVGQGFASMNSPMKRLMELVLTGEFAHAGNKVLRWMAVNTVAEMDPAGNIKPDKKRSREKIDGIVATILALTGAMGAGDGGGRFTPPMVPMV
jgi:phage terminase large subunit-like protein